MKKVYGQSKSSDEDLIEYIKRDSDLLMNQIQEINPEIIICCRTFPLLRGTVIKDPQAVSEGNRFLYRDSNRLIFDYYHPSWYVIPDEMYYYTFAAVYFQYLCSETVT